MTRTNQFAALTAVGALGDSTTPAAANGAGRRPRRAVLRRSASMVDPNAEGVGAVEMVLAAAEVIYLAPVPAGAVKADAMLVFSNRADAHLVPQVTVDPADDQSDQADGDVTELRVPTTHLVLDTLFCYEIIYVPATAVSRDKMAPAGYLTQMLGRWADLRPLAVETDPRLDLPLFARFDGPTGDRFCEGRWQNMVLSAEFEPSDPAPLELAWFRRLGDWFGTVDARMTSCSTYRAERLSADVNVLVKRDGTTVRVGAGDWSRVSQWPGKVDARAAGKYPFDQKLPTLLTRTSPVASETVIQQLGWGDGLRFGSVSLDDTFLTHGTPTGVPGVRVSLEREIESSATYDGPGNADHKYVIADAGYERDELAAEIRALHRILTGVPDLSLATVFAVFAGLIRPAIGHPETRGYARYGVAVHGTTGQYKTSLVMAMMRAWGEFGRDPAANWGGTSQAALIGMVSRSAHVPIVIDDYNPSNAGRSAGDLYSKITVVSEMVGDGAPPARSTQTGAERPSRTDTIKAFTIATAETLLAPSGSFQESRVKRWVQFGMSASTPARNAYIIDVLHPFCGEGRRLSRIERSFLDWLAVGDRRREISARFEAVDPAAWVDLAGVDLGHDRQNKAVLDLYLAWQVWFNEFAVEAAGIPAEEAARMAGQVLVAFIEWSQEQLSEQAASSMSEGARMLNNLRAAAASGRCHFDTKAGVAPLVRTPQGDPSTAAYGWQLEPADNFRSESWVKSQRSELAGWVDGDHVLIWTDQARRWLQGDSDRAPRTIVDRLSEAGLLVPFEVDGNPVNTMQVRCNGQKQRVCRVLRSVFEQWEVE